jgi:hypothetical protein
LMPSLLISRRVSAGWLAPMVVALALVGGAAGGIAPAHTEEPDGVTKLVLGVRGALSSGSPSAFLALSTLDPETADVRRFLDRWFVARTTRAVMTERDRQTLPDGAVRVVAEVLLEAGHDGRLGTWVFEATSTPEGWRVRKVSAASVVDGLYRLELDPMKQFRAHDLLVPAEDFELRLPTGDVFVAEAAGSVTAAVLIGQGEMRFHPAPDAERRQVELFSGKPELRTPFETAFIRLSPDEVANQLPTSQLTPMPVDARVMARAREVFKEQLPKSFGIDLADLSRDAWSLVPTTGNFLAEVATPKFGTLTYANATNDQEDITLFDRLHTRNISIYTSAARLATRGPSYNEDDGREYDVEDYQVDNTFTPERFWMEGRTKLTIRVRAYALSALAIRLAEPLAVQSVSSENYGRLLALRVRGQNSLVVNLPTPASRGDVLALTVRYAGRLEPQGVERENITVDQAVVGNAEITTGLEPEPNFIYSNRAAWYAQGPVSDYGTATIRLTVPTAFSAACSGEPATGSPVTLKPAADGTPARRLFVFAAAQPVRYLGCVVSRFGNVDPYEAPLPRDVKLPPSASPPASPPTMPLRAVSTARQRTRARETVVRAGNIATFYASLVHDLPYPSLTVAVVESQVPGGHAPGYLAILNQPLPTTPFVWRDDPAAFDDYPEFFIAHEIAHQWWGQAVGWKNYHEQWLSEGLAQYFAVLYAEHQRGPQAFQSLVRQLTRWAVDMSPSGPVSLGYRLSYLKNGGRTFRALVYNKGATVLHMLRRMMGDEVFFRALRRFYTAHRFSKAGTDDLRAAMEEESGLKLERFFERWIRGLDLPSLTPSWRVSEDGKTVAVTLSQPATHVFDFPVTVTLNYADGTVEDRTVTVSSDVTTATWPLKTRLRRIEVNRDRLTPLSRK